MTDREREPKPDVKKDNNSELKERKETIAHTDQRPESVQSDEVRDSIKANQEHLQDMTASEFEDYNAAAEEFIDDGTFEQRRVISQEIPPTTTPLPEGYMDAQAEGLTQNQQEAARENVKNAQDIYKNIAPEQQRSEPRSEGATEKHKETARKNVKKSQQDVRRSDK